MTNEHSLSLLDFARVRADVGGYCLSEEGRDALLAESPREDAAEVVLLKSEVAVVLDLLREGGELPSLAFTPVAPFLKRLPKDGASLEVEELYAVALWAESFGAFAAWLAKAPAFRGRGATAAPTARDLPSAAAGAAAVSAILASRPDLAEAARVVWRVLAKDGSLRDLPELKEARDRIARTHREIDALTDSFFRDPETKSMLQSDAPTVRDGRTVLALRANFRGRVRGIVHEVSATGQTVFVEPDELVQRNNDLVQEEARYRQELNRILRDCTARLAEHAEALAAARPVLAVLDGLYARARHAKVGGLVLARDLAEGFVLRRARHPLLGPRAVPIDVELPEGTRTLIITGPNTGGKTVTLKTIGLYALMNQFGLGLPSAPESGLATFDAVWADIGDEQSIDQSLSTFSGHMRVIGGIARGAGERSLVLLDELGSGTDPEEGCAVAMSLLDWFIARKALTVLTTHHGILKNYGYSRSGCLNASMDFDASSLQPTYRVLMGVPGESRALDVAAQNGLDADIVAGARSYLADERADVSELIRGLTEKHRKLEDLEAERRSRLRDAREEQRKADLGALKLRQKELELRERGVSELRRLLGESRKTLENLVKDLREGRLTAEKTREVKDFLADLARSVEGEEATLEASRLDMAEVRAAAEEASRREAAAAPGAGATASAVPSVVAEGVSVLVGPGRKRGVALRKARKGYWVVETESLRMTLPESELLPVADAPPARTQVAVELAPRGEGGRVLASFELDIRGYRLAEALVAVEKQIDAASLQGLGLFSIIHGTGEGVLGKGVQDFLRAQPAVADYHFARPEEGGYGKTVVRLK